MNESITYYDSLLNNKLEKDTAFKYGVESSIKKLSVGLRCNPDQLTTHELQILAKKFSRLYFNEVSKFSNSQIRFKYQYVNYLCQIVLGKRKQSTCTRPSQIITSNLVKPWDILEYMGNLIAVASLDEVFINGRLDDRLSKKGFLFTQVECVGGMLFFSSVYSNIAISLDKSLNVLNKYENTGYITYFNDDLYSINIESLTLNSSLNTILLPALKPWRFRRIDNYLFIADWKEMSTLLKVDLATGIASRVSFDNVLIPHEILKVKDKYLVLDKQQGMIFIYNLNFEYLKQIGCFSVQGDGLCDPISIRMLGEDKVGVLNWLNGDTVVYKL